MAATVKALTLAVDEVVLTGTLAVPRRAGGLVVIVDGSDALGDVGADVAAQLHASGLATLVVDLLTPAESDRDAETGHWRADVALLARRLRAVTSKVRGMAATHALPIGYFACGSAAAAALVAAAELPQAVGAVVSAAGRPDMAGQWLARVHAPTLFVVASEDHLNTASNRDAVGQLCSSARLEVVAGAGHRFEGPAAARRVSELAAGWFSRHLLHSGARWLGPRREDRAFADRAEAGRLLAAELGEYAYRDDVVVLALPRGGVPVACEVAQALGVELDVLTIRKLGFPGHEELALGAVAAGGVRVLNADEAAYVSEAELESITRRQRREVDRMERALRDGRAAPWVQDRTVILVDDGLATGATMRAAIAAVRTRHPSHLVVAVPVAAAQTCGDIAEHVDELVCLVAPTVFFAVAQWYDDFPQCSDDEVRALLARARSPAASMPR